MHRTFRIYLAIALAAMLALTGQSMAVARGATGPAGQIVLCSGSGPVVIDVDENGQPTGRTHICPDCALHLLTAVVPPDLAILPLSTATRIIPVRAAKANADSLTFRATARGPPASV